MASKKELRTYLKNSIKELSSDDYSGISIEACSELAEFINSKSFKNIAIFHSLKDEVDTSSFIENYFDKLSFYLPVINKKNDTMSFRLLEDFKTGLQKGLYSIYEPVDTNNTFDGNWEDEIDCMIIPARGIDYEGNRLGRGKGYYDKMLSKLKKKIVKIGFVFHLQILKQIEVEDHDVPLDYYITEKGTFQLRRGK